MTVNENKNYTIEFDHDEMKAAQTVNEALEFILSLMEDEELANIETEEVLDAEDIETAQRVLQTLFSRKTSHWEH